MAKKFVFLCAGLFLLIAGYSLGAKTVGAQSNGIITSAWTDQGSAPSIWFTSDRTLFIANVSDPCVTHQRGGPIPGASPIVWAAPGSTSEISCVAVLEDGNVYTLPSGGASWDLRGNLFCGATSVEQKTWGQLKARYRAR
jgi:hypothetical protein